MPFVDIFAFQPFSGRDQLSMGYGSTKSLDLGMPLFRVCSRCLELRNWATFKLRAFL